MNSRVQILVDLNLILMVIGGIIVIGYGINKKISSKRPIDQESYNLRTVSTYIQMKIKNNFYKYSVESTEYNGKLCIVIKEKVGEKQYETWLYFRNGYLYELYIEEAEEVDLTKGMKITPALGIRLIEGKEGKVYALEEKQNGEIRTIKISIN